MAVPRQIDWKFDADAAGMRQQADDAVAEINRFFQIMGDEDDGGLVGAHQRQHLVLQSLTRHRVERAERPVHPHPLLPLPPPPPAPPSPLLAPPPPPRRF